MKYKCLDYAEIMVENKRNNKKKHNDLLNFLIAGLVLFYICWGFETFYSGINTKESTIDAIAIGLLSTIIFYLGLYWGIILYKKAYEKYPNTTLKITFIVIGILILWVIFFGGGHGGGYWGTFYYDTHY